MICLNIKKGEHNVKKSATIESITTQTMEKKSNLFDTVNIAKEKFLQGDFMYHTVIDHITDLHFPFTANPMRVTLCALCEQLNTESQLNHPNCIGEMKRSNSVILFKQIQRFELAM